MDFMYKFGLSKMAKQAAARMTSAWKTGSKEERGGDHACKMQEAKELGTEGPTSSCVAILSFEGVVKQTEGSDYMMKC